MPDDPFVKWQDPSAAATAEAADAELARTRRTAATQPIWRRDRRVVALAAGGVLVLALIVGTTLAGGSQTDPGPRGGNTGTVPDTGTVTFDNH